MSTNVTVTTAIKLSAKQVAAITERLEKKHGKISLHEVVDPKVVGGIKLRIGSQELDATLQQKLESIRSQVVAQW